MVLSNKLQEVWKWVSKPSYCRHLAFSKEAGVRYKPQKQSKEVIWVSDILGKSCSHLTTLQRRQLEGVSIIHIDVKPM